MAPGQHDPITKAEQPVHGLKDPRAKDRLFSYTQLEVLIARDLGRPIYTFFIEGDELPTAFAPEHDGAGPAAADLHHRVRQGRPEHLRHLRPVGPARRSRARLEAGHRGPSSLKSPSPSPGNPPTLPYTSLGTLFEGRDEFLAEHRQLLAAEGPVVIKGKRTIRGIGGVGKTRAVIEYAWKHATDYRAPPPLHLRRHPVLCSFLSSV